MIVLRFSDKLFSFIYFDKIFKNFILVANENSSDIYIYYVHIYINGGNVNEKVNINHGPLDKY